MHADQMIAIRNKLNALEKIERIIEDPKTDHDIIIAMFTNIESLKKQLTRIENKLDGMQSFDHTSTVIIDRPKKIERAVKEYLPSFEDTNDNIQIKSTETLSESIQDALNALNNIKIEE